MQESRRSFLRASAVAAAGLSSGLPAMGEPAKPVEQWPEPPASARKPVERKAERKICIFSKHLNWLDYPQMAATAAQLGFDGVDLTVRPDGHVLPERVTEDLPKAVEAVRKAGLDVFMLTTAINDAAHPHTEPILRTAAKLGVRNYRMGWLDYQKDLDVPQNLEVFKTKLTKLAALNKKYNLHGDYQNHAGTHLGASLWDLWLVLRDIDPQWFGCQYDIRHATVEGANSWPIGLQLIRSHIRTLDIKDFLWTQKKGKWVVENVPLGEGMVDFTKYFGLVKAYNLPGPVSLHFEYPLGGAENGAKELQLPRDKVLQAMQKDLSTLRDWLGKNGLNE